MSELPPGSVIITPDDMWKAIEETRDTSRRTEQAVTELKLLVNPALSEVRQDVAELDKRENDHHDAHDARLRALEEQSWSSRWVPAIVTSLLVAVIGGVAMYVITQALN